MKPFAYQAPATLPEAAALLGQRDLRVRAMAGGTDLLAQLRAGRFDLDLIVDIKRIEETNQLIFDPAEGLTIGAAVPCCRIYEDRQIRDFYPALVDSASLIGGVAVQGRATFGGNVCNASPSGDSLPTLMVLGAGCRIFGPGGERVIPIEQFFTGPGTTVLKQGELLVSLQVPPPGSNSGASYLRFIPRQEMDIAVVGVGARVDLSDDRQKIRAARIALGAVAPTPVLATAAGEALSGLAPGEEALDRAAALAREEAGPISDMRGSSAYRRHLIGVLVKRALLKAVDRAEATDKRKNKEVPTHGR